MNRHCNSIKLINQFPDFKASGFNVDAYNEQFKKNNVIINARSRNVSYPVHWGPLSVKCCYGGKENYSVGKRFYSVQDNNFLIINNGQYYSSYIYADTEVESFTLNFTEDTQRTVAASLFRNDNYLPGNSMACKSKQLVFTEKLFTKNHSTSSILNQLKELSGQISNDLQRIEELLLGLLSNLVLNEQTVKEEISKVDVLKLSTKKELYKRLHYVKDFIDSCFQNEITLADMAAVANLNSAYLLRKFKKHFSITPRQYLIKKRMELAEALLKTGNYSITEICFETGYADLTSFGKLFKQFYHCPPEKYKKANQN